MQYCSYSIGLYFDHQSHPQLGVVFALALSLHSFWMLSFSISSFFVHYLHNCLAPGKSKVVKQEMARVNINILGVSELKWAGMVEFKLR